MGLIGEKLCKEKRQSEQSKKNKLSKSKLLRENPIKLAEVWE